MPKVHVPKMNVPKRSRTVKQGLARDHVLNTLASKVLSKEKLARKETVAEQFKAAVSGIASIRPKPKGDCSNNPWLYSPTGSLCNVSVAQGVILPAFSATDLECSENDLLTVSENVLLTDTQNTLSFSENIPVVSENVSVSVLKKFPESISRNVPVAGSMDLPGAVSGNLPEPISKNVPEACSKNLPLQNLRNVLSKEQSVSDLSEDYFDPVDPDPFISRLRSGFLDDPSVIEFYFSPDNVWLVGEVESIDTESIRIRFVWKGQDFSQQLWFESDSDLLRPINFQSDLRGLIMAEERRRALANRGMIIYPIIGDGNCLFSTLSRKVFGHEKFHARLREEIYDYIQLNRIVYQDFDSGLFSSDTFDEFIDRHRILGTFGGTMEISACADLFKRRIVVYSHRLPVEVYGSTFEGDTIYVSFNGMNHYDGVDFIDSSCTKVSDNLLLSSPENIPTNLIGITNDNNKAFYPLSKDKSVLTDSSDSLLLSSLNNIPTNSNEILIDNSSDKVSADQYQSAIDLDSDSLPMPNDKEWVDEDYLEAMIMVSFLPQHQGLLPKGTSLAFQTKFGVICNQWTNDPSVRNLYLVLCFTSVVLAPHITKGKKKAILSRIEAFPDVLTEFPQSRPRTGAPLSDIERAKKLIKAGRVGAAFRILSDHSKKVKSLEFSQAVDKLVSLHPMEDPNPFGDLSRPCFQFDKEEIKTIIRTIKTDTASGASGLSAIIIKTMISSDNFIGFITTLANLIAKGEAKGQALLCLSRLIALDKEGGSLRPIAIGEELLKLCTRAFLSKGRTQDDLLPCQLGVGSLGGVEPIVHSLQEHISQNKSDNEIIIALDVKNAFNSMYRKSICNRLFRTNPRMFNAVKWIYDFPTHLIYRHQGAESHVLQSTRGVRQGCVLGPFLFSVGLYDAISAIEETVMSRGGKLFSYLDDIFIVIPSNGSGVTDAWRDEFLGMCSQHLEQVGLSLNLAKCRVQTCSSAFQNGFNVLGSVIGCEDSQNILLQNQYQSMQATLSKLKRLDVQSGWYLFRNCAVPQLNHLARTLLPDATVETWKRLDLLNMDFIKDMAQLHHLEGFQTDITHLALADGGLGIPELVTRSESGYFASLKTAMEIAKFTQRVGMQPKRGQIKPVSQRDQAKERTDAVREEVLAYAAENRDILVGMVDFSEPIGRAVWRTLPLDSSTVIPDGNFISMLRERLFIPPPKICEYCLKTDLCLGHQFICAKSRHRPNLIRHDALVSTVGEYLSTPTAPAQLECRSDKSGLLRMDVVVSGARAKNGHVSNIDVTVVSPYSVASSDLCKKQTIKSGEGIWTFGKRLVKLLRQDAEDAKRKKYDGLFDGEFVPLVFLSSGSFDFSLYPWLRGPAFLVRMSAIFARSKCD